MLGVWEFFESPEIEKEHELVGGWRTGVKRLKCNKGLVDRQGRDWHQCIFAASEYGAEGTSGPGRQFSPIQC